MSAAGEVTDIAPDGQAARAGCVQRGDRVRAVDGGAVSGPPPYWRRGQGSIRVQLLKRGGHHPPPPSQWH